MSDKERYEYILEHYKELCDEADEYRNEVLTPIESKTLKKAIEMDLFQIGEHVNRLSKDIQKQINKEDLRGIIDTRNIIGHGYQQVDPNILWDTIDYECPKLISQLTELFK
jgi:uncharacterized protein with HEPN domain